MLSMTTKANSLYNPIIIYTLPRIMSVDKTRQLSRLNISIQGCVNLLQLEGHGNYTEQRYSQQFNNPFDFLSFNKELVSEHGSGNYVLDIDSSFFSNSGNKRPKLGCFWSSQAGQVKQRLEITVIDTINMGSYYSFHLEAQTILKEDEDSILTELYTVVITRHKAQPLFLSFIIVIDATITTGGGINHLREDSNLKFLFMDGMTGNLEDPQKHDVKVHAKKIREKFSEQVEGDGENMQHISVVYCLSLECNIRVVCMHIWDGKERNAYKLYRFSRNSQIDVVLILKYYKSRLQIEFVYGGAKQYTGLNDCFIKIENILHFQFCEALYAINIVKVAHWISIPKEQWKTFLMTNTTPLMFYRTSAFLSSLA